MKEVIKEIFAVIQEEMNRKPDPKRFAQNPPAWWYGVKSTPPVADDDFETYEGGTLMWDGAFTHFPGQKQTTKTRLEKAGITPEEWGEMQAYRVSKSQTGLNNISLAGQIKRHWIVGKNAAQISALVGFNASTVRQYVICLERAKDMV